VRSVADSSADPGVDDWWTQGNDALIMHLGNRPAKPTDMNNRLQPNNPLHGITLETIVSELVAHFGWQELGQRIPIRCFTHDPSVASSLKFLRRTPWAKKKVEDLYLVMCDAR
jgi:hypothetical protein